MFFTVSSQVTSAATSYWASQFALCSAFNAKTLASMAKLSELNLHAIQETLGNSSMALQQSPSSDQAAASDRAQKVIEAARAYGRQVADIAFDMRAESTHLVQDSVNAATAQIDACLDGLSQQAPEAAGGVLQLMRAAIGNVNKGCDQMITTSDQAAQAVADSLDSRSHPLH